MPADDREFLTRSAVGSDRRRTTQPPHQSLSPTLDKNPQPGAEEPLTDAARKLPGREFAESERELVLPFSLQPVLIVDRKSPTRVAANTFLKPVEIDGHVVSSEVRRRVGCFLVDVAGVSYEG